MELRLLLTDNRGLRMNDLFGHVPALVSEVHHRGGLVMPWVLKRLGKDGFLRMPIDLLRKLCCPKGRATKQMPQRTLRRGLDGRTIAPGYFPW
jgi:hypothetical protein